MIESGKIMGSRPDESQVPDIYISLPHGLALIDDMIFMPNELLTVL